MQKHYLFLSARPLPKAAFLRELVEAGVGEETVIFADDYGGEFLADARESATFDEILARLSLTQGWTVSILSTHQNTAFEQKLLKGALRYLPNLCSFPTDVMMKEISFGDFSSFGPLMRLFREANKEQLLTAGTYLRCGLDACLGAKKLGVHRNTFNYRLNGFIEKTGLDIRDYHNALLLELYFDFGGGRS